MAFLDKIGDNRNVNGSNNTPGRYSVTTNLVHAPLRYTAAWWKSALVADIPGQLGGPELAWLGQHLDTFVNSGLTSIIVRPAQLNILVDPEPLRDFINQAHQIGLRAIVRVSGGSDFINGIFTATPSAFRSYEIDSEHTLSRATKALQLGADGIDLGMLVDPSTDPTKESNLEELDKLLRNLHRAVYEYRQEAIIGAFTMVEHELYQHYLDNYLFHHLRDNQLLDIPWNARQIRDNIAKTLSSRDSLHQISAWRTSSTFTDFPPAGISESWYQEDSRKRRRALTMLALSLPGAVYLRGNRVLDLPWLEQDPTAKCMTPEQIKHYRELMTLGCKIRTANELGTGFLAWVEGAPWASEDVLVQLGTRTMTVLNTSNEVITVPPESKPLLSSQRLFLNPDDPKSHQVRPNECAWYQVH